MAKIEIKSGRVAVNGINYYYEIHSRGEPLLLLHGGLGSIEMFEPDITTLAENRMVIAVDLQGHGRTELGDRPINLVDMGDDMAAILFQLGMKGVDVMGYSMGGGVALRLGRAASGNGSPLGTRFHAICAGRVLSRNAATAGSSWRCYGGYDEGDADVQVLCRNRTSSGGFFQVA